MQGPRLMAYAGGPISVEPGLRGVCRIVVLALLLAGCTRNPGEPARDEQAGSVAQAHEGIVTISGDDTILESLTWRPPAVEIPPDGIADAIERAGQVLEGGNLAADAESARRVGQESVRPGRT